MLSVENKRTSNTCEYYLCSNEKVKNKAYDLIKNKKYKNDVVSYRSMVNEDVIEVIP